MVRTTEIPLMEEAVFVDENSENLPDFYDIFRPVILNIPTEIFRKYMNRTCSALLEYIAWYGTKLDKKTGELVIRPVIISQTFFCKRFGLSRVWIGKMTKRLEELGYLEVYRRKDNQGRYLANVYMISEHILNKALLKLLKSGELRNECEKLQNLNLNSWIFAIPEGIADIPPPPEMRNKKTFQKFFRTVFFHIKDGKLSYEDFMNLLVKLFDLKKELQQEKKDGENVKNLHNNAENIDTDADEWDLSEAEGDDLSYEYQEDWYPEEECYEEDHYEDHFYNYVLFDAEEEKEDRKYREDYICSGFRDMEKKILDEIGASRTRVVIHEVDRDNEHKERMCPACRVLQSDQSNGRHVAFYCKSGDETYLCVCAPEKEFRRAIFRSKELSILKVMYNYFKSKYFPIVTDIQISRVFKISRRRARYLMYLLGATSVVSGYGIWNYFTEGIECPYRRDFALDWVVKLRKESIPVLNEEKGCLSEKLSMRGDFHVDTTA